MATLSSGQPWIHLIVPAKRSYVAYLSTQKTQASRVKLWTRFGYPGLFTEANHPVHQRPIRYYEHILFWSPAECFLRFVWIVDGHRCWVLMGTDLTLDPLEMIRLYLLRSKIEVLFKVLTHVIGAFRYRFWTTACPKLSKKKQSKTTDLVGPKQCKKMLSTLRAIESFVNFAGIVTGILQYLALTYHQQIWRLHEGSSWLRTYSSEIPSEEVVQRVIQCHFFVRPQTKALAWIRTMVQHTNKQKQIGRKVRKHGTFRPPDHRRKLT